MSGFVEVKNDSVTIRHHSTSSTIEITFETADHDAQKIWIDYYEWEDLKKAIKETGF